METCTGYVDDGKEFYHEELIFDVPWGQGCPLCELNQNGSELAQEIKKLKKKIEHEKGEIELC